MGTGLLDRLSCFQKGIRVGRINRAVPGDDQRFLSKGDLPDLDTVVGQIRPDIHQFVNGFHAIHALNVLKPEQTIDHGLAALVADNGVNVTVCPVDDLDLASKIADNGLNFSQLLIGQRGSFGNNHSAGLLAPYVSAGQWQKLPESRFPLKNRLLSRPK
jgi:hypothetical protein